MLKNFDAKLYIICSVFIVGIMCVLSVTLGINEPLSVLVTGALLTLQWYVFTAARYRSMRRMTEEIDSILHGAENLSLSDYREGELSLLKNEICKMTIMLKSQAEELAADKVGLADSLADISHQIRTPLTSLNIMLAALKKDELSPEKKRETLFEMGRQLERIDRLVTSLLKLAKIDAGTVILKKEQVELEKLIDNALQPLEIMLDLKGITVQKKLGGSYIGDMAWSEEAVGNILKNCMEHTGEGGVISVNGYENAMYTEIVIEDNGSGIDEADLPHIFERFYKGSGSGDASYGIGLALSKRIIAEQNGTVKAENCSDNCAENHTENCAESHTENLVGNFAMGRLCGTSGARFIIRFYKGVV